MQQVKNENAVRVEVAEGDYIPFRAHVSSNIVKIAGGAYITTWKVGGISFEAADEFEVSLRHNGFNQLLKSIGGAGIALWTHKVRRVIKDRFSNTVENPFAREFSEKYYDNLEKYRMLTVDLYLTVVYSPSRENNAFQNIFNRAIPRSATQIASDESEAITVLNDIARQVESSLRRYDLERLGEYKYKGVRFSSALELYAFLINGFWARVPLRYARINEYLPTTRIFAQDEFIELRMPHATRFAVILDFADYPEECEPGLVNPTLYLDCEYVETQSYTMLNKRDAVDALKRQRGQLIASEDGAKRQIDAIANAIEEVENGSFVMGDYHYSMTIFGDTIEKVGSNVAKIQAELNEVGFKTAKVDLVPEAAYWAQLPGNWRYRPREAQLSSRVFCGLAPFHNFTSGKRDDNPWGEAVTILKSPSGQPIYFNFHTTPEDQMSFDDKALANTLIMGGSQEGKTALKMALITHAMKQDFTGVFFDKDRGEEIALRMLGAQYFSFKAGLPTWCSPLKQEPTPRNKLMWHALIKTLTRSETHPFSSKDEEDIAKAIETVSSFEKDIRGLTAIVQNLQDDGNNSVKARLKKWTWGAQFGWVLDCPEDRIQLDTHKLYGFDYTDFLDNAEIRTPLMMYLMHITESLIDGRRFIYGMAEFWKPLEDPVFTDFAKNKQKTIRKQNGFGIFDTQSPSDALESAISRTLIEQMATIIFLPNVRATKSDYIDGFKCSQAEWEIIHSFPEQSRMCLIKQGHRSTVASYSLEGLEEFIDILSGSTDNIQLLDQIRAELETDDPQTWLPVLRERIALRRSIGKVQKTTYAL